MDAAAGPPEPNKAAVENNGVSRQGADRHDRGPQRIGTPPCPHGVHRPSQEVAVSDGHPAVPCRACLGPRHVVVAAGPCHHRASC